MIQNTNNYCRCITVMLVALSLYLLCFLPLQAQNVFNTGSTITIQTNTTLYNTGSYIHTTGQFDNNGELIIRDSLVNNDPVSGIFGDNTNKPTAGRVIFNGSGLQQVSGSGMPVYFYEVTYDNSSAPLMLYKPVFIENSLTLSTGNINLNGRVIDLGLTGSVIGEANLRRILGTRGYIAARRNITPAFTGEVAGMGFYLDASGNSFGITEIRRFHHQLSPFNSNGHIIRYFDFRPQFPATAPANSLRVSFFSNEQLPAHTASDYKIFHSPSDGFGWIKETRADGNNPAVDFQVHATNVSRLGTSAQGRSLVTVSESNCANATVIDLGPTSRDLCAGSALELSSEPGQQQYIWKKDGTTIPAASTHTLSVTQGGLYELIAIDANGCEGRDEITIILKQKPIADFQVMNFACAGQASVFNNLSTSADGSITYAWNFGDPARTDDLSSLASPSYIYTNAGTFNASLTVTSEFGCVSEPATKQVIVHALPTAAFSSNAVCLGYATSFTNNSAAGLTLEWDFGNSNTSTETAPSFTFPFAGLHPVTLTAINPNTTCRQATTRNVTVHPKPIADFTADPLCRPNEKFFNNTSLISSGTLSFSWDFGDGEVSILSNPLKVYQQEGTYPVTLTATSSFGCSAEVTKQVAITLRQPIFPGDVKTCAGQVILDANPGNRFTNATYRWSDNSENETLTITRSGTYSVTVSLPDGCQVSESVRVTLNTILAPDLGSAAEACDRKVLDAGFYPNGTYTWSTGATTQTIVVMQSGTYTVQVTDQNGCQGSGSVDVTIHRLPVVDLGPDQVLCHGTTTRLDAGTSGDTYRWSDGSTNRFYTAGASGQYSVEVKNQHGCVASDQVRITVLEPLRLELGPDKVICGGIPLTLDAGLTNVSYEWGSTAGISGKIRTLEVTKGGKYWITVTGGNGCTASDTINVNETANTLHAAFLAASEVKPGDTIQFVNLSYPHPFTSAWNFGNGQASTAEDPTMIYYAEGNFNVSLTVSNGICTTNTTKTIRVNLQAGGRVAPEPAAPKDDIVKARVYPNPTNGILNVDVELSAAIQLQVRIATPLGVSLYERVIETSHLEDVIHIHDFTPGVYFITFKTPKQNKTLRILKH